MHTLIANKIRSRISFNAVLVSFLYIIASVVLIYALGYHGAKGIDILLMLLILLTLPTIPLLRYLLVIPFFILCAIYFPIGYIYGKPSVSVISALMQTNKLEAHEFLLSMPVTCYLLPILVIALLTAINRYAWRSPPPVKRMLPYWLLLILIVLSYAVTHNLHKLKLTDYFISIFTGYQDYQEQIAQLDMAHASAPDWQVVPPKERQANYVIIIGESMRRDYMSLFGYPLPTTPFLDQVNGDFYSNYISTASNTFESLPRTLALSQGEQVDYANNVVTLAKAAGMKTYWFSNQGLVGDYDIPASRIAAYSDRRYFLKHGDYQSLNTDDYQLLPPFADALKDNHNGLFILHIMGSHSDFCERLNGAKPAFSFDNQDLSCYLSTYRKTDDFIQQTYRLLQQTQRPFKLFYFSDHGLARHNIGGKFYLRHSGEFKQNYEVPLVILSDNATRHRQIATPYSAFNFIQLFARQTGITITRPDMAAYALQQEPRRVYVGRSMVDFDGLAEDKVDLPDENHLHG
ncbi:phosphoethanolamine transferase [Serratia rubidaea]|uniref:phosphoethanolamine transferase n=1 Tax=Serratia rubidaea TaxID=61652 RepID=UPI001E596DE7|nr:phosphoethanolamine transferase [Serratia rubidaea]